MTPVVMLHGIGADGRLWQPQRAPFAARGYEAIPLDLPGYGARPPVEALNFDTMAADVEAAIGASGLQRPVLLGHSMGGMVAQTLLRRRPDAYSAAILCATSPAFGNPSGEFQREFVSARLRPLEEGRTLAELAPETLAALTGPNGTPFRDLVLAALAATPPATFRAAVQALVAFDERASLGAIRVPVLLLAGEVDTNAPAPMMQRMAGKISGAAYICLPNIGHLPNIEAPDAFDAAVLDFLDGHLKGPR